MRGLKINTPFYTISFYSHFIFGKNKSKERICINILDGLSCVDKRLFSFSKYPFRVDESVDGKKTESTQKEETFCSLVGETAPCLEYLIMKRTSFLAFAQATTFERRQVADRGDCKRKFKVYWMKFAYKTESDCLSRI